MKSRISSDVFLHVPDTPSIRDDSKSSPSRLKGTGRRLGEAEKHVEDENHLEKENYVENETEVENGSEDETCRYLIFFITGNPGLIGYYRPFLSRLVRGLSEGIRDLSSGGLDGVGLTGTEDDDETAVGNESGKATAKSRSRRKAEVVVFGSSLGGFEVDSDVHDDIDDGREKTDGKEVDGGGDTQLKKESENENNDRDTDGDGNGNEHGHDYLELETDLIFPTSTMKQRRRNRDIVGLRTQVELCIARLKEVARWMHIHEPSESQNQSQGQSQSQSQSQSSPETRDIKKSSPDSKDSKKSTGKIKVILIGHSVGAWIALEIVHQLHQLNNTPPSNTPNAISTPPYNAFDISAAILLTPTIFDLALSNTGRLAAPVMGGVLGGYLPSVAQHGAAALSLVVRVVGEERVRGFVGGITGMGRHGGGNRGYLGREGGEEKQKQREGEWEDEGKDKGENGLDVTMKFLLSANGVRQALALAGEELKIITADGWGEEVWGGPNVGRGTGSTQSPKLYFLFAGKDHWVADETREEIIQKTGQPELEGRHVLEIDEQLEHAWCLRQSGRVADKVGQWIEEIIEDGD